MSKFDEALKRARKGPRGNGTGDASDAHQSDETAGPAGSTGPDGSPFSISKSIRYCPFCNADLDTENTSSSITHHERAAERHGGDDHTATIKIKLFKRLFMELIFLVLMFSTFTVGLFQNPKERYDMFIFSTLFIAFLFCQFYMAYYLGIKGLIEYDFEIYPPSFNIALIFWKTTNKTPRKFVFIVYIAAFLGLVLCGIALYLTSSHH